MIAAASADLVNRWRMEKCHDHIAPAGIEHARFLLSFHAGHGCCRFLDGLAYTSAVME
ncbi:hypothetical protein [Nocardia brevicatena]|uniref:hypothetical protein n=1 Tax=Nocardia brevicatena TaxID=37327 RepID=UPI00031AAB0C|nr:hypothetical protein [Nocardia brevicatena]